MAGPYSCMAIAIKPLVLLKDKLTCWIGLVASSSKNDFMVVDGILPFFTIIGRKLPPAREAECNLVMGEEGGVNSGSTHRWLA
jgi:hypothetical protein